MSRNSADLERYARPGLSLEEIEELREAFDLFDVDGTGYVDGTELKTAIEQLGYRDRNPIIYEAVERMNGRQVSFDQFLDLMTTRITDSSRREDIEKVFRLFVGGRPASSSFITVDDLRRVAKELGESLSEQDLREMIDRADIDGDARVSVDEFVAIMSKRVCLSIQMDIQLMFPSQSFE